MTTRVFDVAVEPLGNGAQIVRDRRVQLDRALARRPHDNFLHVQVGRVQQSASLAGRQHHDGVRLAGGAEVGSFQRIDGDIHLRIFAALVANRRALLFRR